MSHNILDGLYAATPDQAITVSGINPSVQTASLPEDIWENGNQYPWPAAFGPASIVSSNANDTAGGTGARAILVNGLNDQGIPVSETIALNGTSLVPLVNAYFRINSMQVVDAGSNEINFGNIDLAIFGTTVARIFGNAGRTQMAVFTTPANGPTLRCKAIWTSTYNDAATNLRMTLLTRKQNQAFMRETFFNYFGPSPAPQLLYPAGFVIEPFTDIVMRCLNSTADVGIYAGFELTL